MAFACTAVAVVLSLPSLALLWRAAWSFSSPGGGAGGSRLGMGRALAHHALLTLHNTSLAFFLVSFHVHEKAILFPALPLALLTPVLPAKAREFALLAVWSMGALLARDGLVVPAAFLCTLYLLCQSSSSSSIWGMAAPRVLPEVKRLGGLQLPPVEGGVGMEEEVEEEAAALGIGETLHGCALGPYGWMDGGALGALFARHSWGAAVARQAVVLTRTFLWPALVALLFATAGSSLLVSPPQGLPFIFSKVTAILCALAFGAHLVWGLLVQAQWCREDC
jgi:hypothetical protein